MVSRHAHAGVVVAHAMLRAGSGLPIATEPVSALPVPVPAIFIPLPLVVVVVFAVVPVLAVAAGAPSREPAQGILPGFKAGDEVL